MDSVVFTRKFNLAARSKCIIGHHSARITLLKGCFSALFLYEYLLTFDLEVEYFWRSRLTRATALYFANRYTNVALAITNVIELVVKTESDQVTFSVLRVHAVTDRNCCYTLVVLLAAMVSPAILAYIVIRSYGHTTPAPLHACTMSFTLSLAEYD
ncbi:hypothetical protein K466DRAFT_547390, partial [Polyporus arcularius HHB13444]